MSGEIPVPLSVSVDEEALLDAVRQALGDDSAALGAWQIAPLAEEPISPNTLGLYRICAETSEAWSLIAKVVAPPADPAEAPNNPLYSRRESILYPSGLLSDLPWGLAVP